VTPGGIIDQGESVEIDPVHTPRMTVRPIAHQDRAEFVRVHEAAAPLYAPWIGALDPGETWEDVFDRVLEMGSRDNQLRLVATLADGRIAGFFNLGHIVRAFAESAQADWRTNPEIWGQGFGTEGVSALLDVAFSPPPNGLGLHRVQASITPSNVRSIRLAERVGFRREGLALKALKVAGVWQDQLLYAKLVEEHPPNPFRTSGPGPHGSSA
jgi:ribosomal-protein-alanine N-acetyltransferase